MHREGACDEGKRGRACDAGKRVCEDGDRACGGVERACDAVELACDDGKGEGEVVPDE